MEPLHKPRGRPRVLLLRGVHNGLGVTADVRRRILIRGEGALREATLDARANSPAFRILRRGVIQNVEVDFTGFCEAAIPRRGRRARETSPSNAAR